LQLQKHTKLKIYQSEFKKKPLELLPEKKKKTKIVVKTTKKEWRKENTDVISK
jgi:hypothetical protein